MMCKCGVIGWVLYRTDEKKGRFTGVLCGLGYDIYNKGSALYEYDMEIAFDATFDLDDITKVLNVADVD